MAKAKQAAKFTKGQKVWYLTFSGERQAATITGFGEKELGERMVPVISVRVEGDEHGHWGYEDQFEAR